MKRLLLCLPFFVFFAFLYQAMPTRTVDKNKAVKKVVQAVPAHWFHLFAASPNSGTASSVPWLGVFQVTNNKTTEVDKLPDSDILAFLQKVIDRYQREVTGYKAILRKQERVNGVLKQIEVVRVAFKENPHSVHMKWLKGAGLAAQVVYVDGENDNKLLVKPAGVLSFLVRIVTKDPRGPEAKSSGRITIDNFGMCNGTKETLSTWTKAKKEDNLFVKYEGVWRVGEAGNRLCYKIHRSPIPNPHDGVGDVVLYFDIETWLQVGSILLDEKGAIIGEYYFRDIELNPEYPKGYFGRKLLSKR